jgi:hypothetical protein
VTSRWPPRFLPGAAASQQGQDVADGRFLAGGLAQRQVRLDLIAIAAAGDA